MVLITASCTISRTFNCSSSGISDLIPWIYCHFHYIIIRDLIYVIPEWSSGFPYLLQFKSEFGNKEFMFCATVSSESCFYWLYRTSSYSATKNIINLISVLTIWWCPRVESSLVLLKAGVCYDQCILFAELYSLCPASFCTARPNLPVTPGVSWLPTFALQSPIMKRISLWGVSSRRSCRSS